MREYRGDTYAEHVQQRHHGNGAHVDLVADDRLLRFGPLKIIRDLRVGLLAKDLIMVDDACWALQVSQQATVLDDARPDPWVQGNVRGSFSRSISPLVPLILSIGVGEARCQE